MILFNRSFGLTRSLFILYVHEHDRLGDRKGQSYLVEYYLESADEYSEGKIRMSEPESGRQM